MRVYGETERRGLQALCGALPRKMLGAKIATGISHVDVFISTHAAIEYRSFSFECTGDKIDLGLDAICNRRRCWQAKFGWPYLCFDTELFFCWEASPALPFNDDGNKKTKRHQT